MAETRKGGGSLPGSKAGMPVRLLVWLALLNAVLLYGVVSFLVARPAAEPSPIPAGLFPALGVLLAAAAVFSPRFLPDSSPSRDSEGRSAPAVGIRTKEFVMWALDESVAVVGLVAALLGGDPKLVVPYVVVGAGLLVLHRPKG
jgi:hypothetical protein